MARVKLDLPDRYEFSTDITVRITDINYGGHLGNDAMLSLIHEARMRFLNHHGFTEANVDGAGIIMTDAVIVYKTECFYGDILRFEVGVRDIGKSGCDIVYRIFSKEKGSEVARAKTGIVFFDYAKRMIMEVPDAFLSIFGNTA
jgi:acyl-CoA thioester hydrolase